jgi:hypothetical protein
MPTPPTAPPEPRTAEQLRKAALDRLRQGTNPFTFSVATAGTEESCEHFDVPELLDAQRRDLRAVVELFRQPPQPSRAFPILGDSGTGKTHLLNTFQTELQREAEQEGKACLVVVADHFSVGLDAIDFFFWQIVNHLLARSGPGAHIMRGVSVRLTARLLAEALRQMPPDRQARLVPARGFWDAWRFRLGGRAAVQARLDVVSGLINLCDLAPADVRSACSDAGIAPEQALGVIEEHLAATEGRDTAGSLRRDLYARLARVCLLEEREPIEDFLTGEYLQGGAQVVGAGQSTRRLLTALLELFRTLVVPIVLVFDQLEDFLVAPTQERRAELRNAFGQALAALIDNVPGLCVLIFGERALWYETILAGIDPYARTRLDQEFGLPGRAARRSINMPDRISREHLTRLVQRRVRPTLDGMDLAHDASCATELPAEFPFEESQLRELESESTVRGCLRKLSRWFNEIVYLAESPPQGAAAATRSGVIAPASPGAVQQGKTTPPPTASSTTGPAPDDQLLAQLGARWQTALAAARRILQEKGYCAALIPEVQTALHRWLTHLKDTGLTGSGPWSAVELLTDTSKGPFGYLSVIRVDQADRPGLGLAAWLGERRGRMEDLQRRLQFFEHSSNPIRTLVLFRRDGEAAIAGGTKDIYDAARTRRDIRVHRYEEADLVALLAFPLWQQAVTPDLDAARDRAVPTRQAFVARLSERLLGWIDSWRQPTSGVGI